MRIHLVDGTYELFRSHFGAPPRRDSSGREVGATIGLLRSLWLLLSTPGVTHVACAFDHVIESFRNDLYAGYKTSAGVDPDLLAQFELAERAVRALGVVVWPMVEFEADDALAAAAARFRDAPGVDQVVLCSPDKDLAQAVVGDRVVAWDRRRDIVLDDAGVIAKFGVPPASIPDWLALVGDSADGFPGIPGWGAKSAATVLARFGHVSRHPGRPGRARPAGGAGGPPRREPSGGPRRRGAVPPPRDAAAGRAARGERRRPRVARRHTRLRRAVRRARRRGSGPARRGGRRPSLTVRRSMRRGPSGRHRAEIHPRRLVTVRRRAELQGDTACDSR